MTEVAQSPITAYLTVRGGLDAIALHERAFRGMRYGRLRDLFGHASAFGAPLPDSSEGQSS